MGQKGGKFWVDRIREQSKDLEPKQRRGTERKGENNTKTRRWRVREHGRRGKSNSTAKETTLLWRTTQGVLLQYRKTGPSRCLYARWHKIAWHWNRIYPADTELLTATTHRALWLPLHCIRLHVALRLPLCLTSTRIVGSEPVENTDACARNSTM